MKDQQLNVNTGADLSPDDADQAGAFQEDALGLADAEASVGDAAMTADEALGAIAQGQAGAEHG